MQELVLVRGLPGAGKSTFARALESAYHFEADMWFERNGGWNPAFLKTAHQWCLNQVGFSLACGASRVVAANTFVKEWEMDAYYQLAAEYGARVVEITVFGNYQNVHNVPPYKIEQMRSNFFRRPQVNVQTVELGGLTFNIDIYGEFDLTSV